MGYNPQESVENTINTMGTLLRAHPIVHWIILGATGFISKESPFVIVPNTSQYSILGFVLLVIFCRFYQGFSHHWTTIWKNIFYFFSASNKQFQVFRSPPYITFGFPFIVPPRREPLAFHRAFRINCRRRSFLKKNLKNLCAAFFSPQVWNTTAKPGVIWGIEAEELFIYGKCKASFSVMRPENYGALSILEAC